MSYRKSTFRVQALHKALKSDESLSDEYILEQLEDLHIVTGTLHAAAILMRAFAPVCAARPHLVSILLPRVLFPLYYTGYETDNVMSWIEAFLESKEPAFGGNLSSSSRQWVESILSQREMIDQMMQEILVEEAMLSTEEARSNLLPYNNLPEERIGYLTGEVFSQLPAESISIVFIYLSSEYPDNQQAFALLTETIAELDPDEKINLYVIDGVDYIDNVHMNIVKMLEAEGGSENDLVQAIWFVGKDEVAVVKAGDIDSQKYKGHTRKILT